MSPIKFTAALVSGDSVGHNSMLPLTYIVTPVYTDCNHVGRSLEMREVTERRRKTVCGCVCVCVCINGS